VTDVSELRQAADDVMSLADTILEDDATPLLVNAVMLAKACLAEHPADGGENGWRPIETAPRDGTWFVIFTHGWYEVGRYSPSMYDHYVEVEGGLYRKEKEPGYEWEGFNNFHAATHWMPLAAPPRRRDEVSN
jgi:hypothetical protein